MHKYVVNPAPSIDLRAVWTVTKRTVGQPASADIPPLHVRKSPARSGHRFEVRTNANACAQLYAGYQASEDLNAELVQDVMSASQRLHHD